MSEFQCLMFAILALDAASFSQGLSMPNADAMEPCIYDFARLLTQEQGKPIEQARNEICVSESAARLGQIFANEQAALVPPKCDGNHTDRE